MITKSRVSDVSVRHEVASIPGDDYIESVTMGMFGSCTCCCRLHDFDEALGIMIIFNIKMKVQVTNEEDIFMG